MLFRSIDLNHHTILNDHLERAESQSGECFDAIATCGRPRAFDLVGWARLLGLLNRGFTRVYDLQTSDRSSFYRNLMGFPFSRPPEWSGIAAGSSHPHANPARDFQHTVERQREQLLVAGINSTKSQYYSGKGPIPDSAAKKIMADHEIGMWNFYGALYGPPPIMDTLWSIIHDS